jgi:hypothetical protein
MGLKKKYIKPVITLINLDNTITLMMISNPGPRGGGKKGGSDGADTPFQSPFGDKPFG